MFKELAPLFHQRSVVIMINPIEDDKLTVAVLPKKLNDSENAALSTPVSVTGTPEELDEQLPSTLTQFVGAHLELKNTLELAKEEMARAAKAAKQESKSKTTAKSEATTTTTSAAKPGDQKTTTQPAKAAQAKTPPPAATGNLFDFGAPPPTPTPVATIEPAPVETPAVEEDDESEEEEILSENSDEQPAADEFEDAA